MQSAYSKFCLNVAYPFFDRLRGRKLTRRIEELMANQRKSLAELEADALKKLQLLVAHASATSPYYRQRLGNPVISSFEDFAKLPILTKSDIQAHVNEILSSKYDKKTLIAGRTGGSTGAPTRFYHDTESADYIRAGVIRVMSWAGASIGDKVVKVSGSHFDYDLAKKLSVRVTTAILRQQWFSAVDLAPEKIDARFAQLQAWKPDFFWGYASGIDELAKRLLESKRVFPVRGVLTSSDNLTPPMRARIESAFQAPVFNAYGSREMAIGGECHIHSGFHICSDIVRVEIVDDQGKPVPPNQSGRVIVTDLHNFAFPFIRYDIGDRGTMAEFTCSCGLPFPLLKSLDGRSDEYIISPDGKRISPPAFTVLMSDLATLKEYQIKQEADFHINVFLVVREGWNDADLRHVTHGLDTLFGQSLPYKIVFCERIDYGESGKRRAVRSAVKQ